MSVNHYENFPVGSIMLPRRLRKPVHAVYAFARYADDVADEGDADNDARLAALAALRAELDLIGTGGVPQTALMRRLYEEAVLPFGLDLQPFYDLLSAFAQDVVKTRYQNFAELADYCRRSANPVGRILLQLYGETDTRSLARSDGICTALQLINFWQDVAGRADFAFQRLMAYQCGRAFKMLKAGAPLGRTLKGRIGFELRMIVVGGQIILQKLDGCRYNVFEQRPVLGKKDWWLIVKRAFLKK